MSRIWIIAFGDLIAFWVAFWVILSIRYWNIATSDMIQAHILPFLILYISWILTFFLFGLYDLYNIKPTIPYLRRFSLALLVSFIIGIIFFYFIPIFGISPKTNLLFQVLGFGLISFFLRKVVYTLFSNKIVRPIILVGKTRYIEILHNVILKNPQLGLKISCYTKDMYEALQNHIGLKGSVFVFEGTEQEIPKKDIVMLYKNKSEIIDVAEAYEIYLHKIPVGYITQSWVIKNINTQKDFIYDFFRRILDLIISILILIVTSPFMVVSAFAIYLYDHGPIFYTQDRIGLNNKTFKLYKLRSMVVDAEKNGAIWSDKKDSRITPVGKIIRKLHIDEIPQMINILKGDLSLVGPRPERPEFVELLEKSIPHYELRHIVRPGFTGWAQIKYRYARTTEDSKEKFEYDLYYLKNRNIFLDFGIIIRTIQIIFTH